MANVTYSVENGTGDTSGEGMTSEQARTAAQAECNRTGATRYIVSSDPDEGTTAVEPEGARRYLVSLSDLTPNRATVESVRRVAATDLAPNRETGRSPISAPNYAIVTDADLVPVVGERVWIDDGTTLSRGERTITARGREVQSGVTITASISDGMSRNAGGERQFTADTLDDAIEQAEEWVREGSYTSPDSDTVEVSLVIVQGGEVVDRRTVTVDATREVQS